MLDESAHVGPANSLVNALKRLRPDDEPATNTPLDSCIRSLNFWHDEGTIILRVDDTLFRVHRDLLSTHFIVFKDVFAIPQPADPEQFGGCQVMAQSGDRREDWETALTFMYSPLDLHPWHKELKAQQLVSLVRLAHKYQGDKLLRECVNRLKVEFPTRLDTFRKLYPPHRSVHLIEGRASLTNSVHDLITLVNAALELEIECILPCAYYLLLMKFEPVNITDPPLTPDGTKVGLNPRAQQALFLGYSEIYPALLDSIGRWIVPQDDEWPWWCREEHDYARGFIEDEDMPDPPECRQDFDSIRARIFNYIYHQEHRKLLLLASCKHGEYCSHIFDGLCDHCRSAELKIGDDYLLQFWLKMPKAFGVGESWNDLKYYNY